MDIFADLGPVGHRIVCRSGWDGCPGSHRTTALVRQCFEAVRDGAWPCTWMIEVQTEDGPLVADCGSPSRYVPELGAGACQCERGHDHVPAHVRAAQGWDYAEDQDEARQLVLAGVEPRTMDGHVWPQ